jgi:allantoinase
MADRPGVRDAPAVISVVRGTRIVTPNGVRTCTIHIEDGRVTRLSDTNDVPAGASVLDVGDLVVMPGLVDTHVHVNEPGRTEWEGFATATRAAAAGGVTTLLDMPLNSIPATTSVAALEAKARAAAGRTWVDVGFIGGVVPGNAAMLRELHEAGVLAFKCFLVPSGVPEFAHVSEADLREAMPVLASFDALLMVHAEAPAVIDAAMPHASNDRRSYATYLASRPAAAEHEAIAMILRLAEDTGARVHIVHVSSGESLPLIAAARARGVRISAESCPHYLTLDASCIPDGATEYKCAPPIRSRADRDALWSGLACGDLDMIVSDHSPCPPDMKGREAGDFLAAWGGIASLQLGASIIWTEMHARGIALERLAHWMSDAPARLVGLASKGRIESGFDADFVIFDPDAEWHVDATSLEHRHPVTPYAGRRLRGAVCATYVRGTLAYDRERGPTTTPRGRLLLQDETPAQGR